MSSGRSRASRYQRRSTTSTRVPGAGTAHHPGPAARPELARLPVDNHAVKLSGHPTRQPHGMGNHRGRGPFDQDLVHTAGIKQHRRDLGRNIVRLDRSWRLNRAAVTTARTSKNPTRTVVTTRLEPKAPSGLDQLDERLPVDTARAIHSAVVGHAEIVPSSVGTTKDSNRRSSRPTHSERAAARIGLTNRTGRR